MSKEEKAYSGDLVEVTYAFNEPYSVGDILEVDMRQFDMGACDDDRLITTEGSVLHDTEYKIFKKNNPKHKQQGQQEQQEQLSQKVFLISDTHFSHKNILEYERRPFNSTNIMDEFMINEWNSKVSKNDLVFHLGDVCICGAKRAEEILPRLNGRKILILGNHDHFSKTKWRKLGFEPYERYFYKDYLLTHIPVDEEPLRVAVENGLLKGNIHGHVHSQNQHLDQKLYRCACVELQAYCPIEFSVFEELHKKIN